MEQSRIIPLPTPLNIETAWAEYQKLARQFADNPELRLDLEFNQRFARAWARWRDLYISFGAAA